MYCSWKDWWIHRAVTFFTLYSSNFLKELIRHVGSSQSGAQSIVYELDTSQHKARLGLEQLSLVILCSCTNKSQTTTTEQCQVAAGSIWDGPRHVATHFADPDPLHPFPGRFGFDPRR